MATDIGSKNINGYFKTIPDGVDSSVIETAKPIDVGNLSYVTSVFEGSGSSDSTWLRHISGYIRPITITDKVIVGGTTFNSDEVFSVVGKLYASQCYSAEISSPLFNIQDGTHSSQIYSILTDDRTVLLPDKDGTIAFTDDISAVNWSDIVGKPSSSTTNIDLAVTNSHTHTNKSTLDTYVQTEVNLASAVSLKHNALTIGTANGLSFSGTQELTIALASTSTTGSLSSTNWNTFNDKQDALGYTPENIANKNLAGGYAGLDSSGKIDPSRIPTIATGNIYVVADQIAMLALSASVGDVAKQTTTPIRVYMLQTLPATDIGNWVDISTSIEQIYTQNCPNGDTDISLGAIVTYSKFELSYSATITGKIRSEIITAITDGSSIVLGEPGYISLPEGDDCGMSFAVSINAGDAVLTVSNSNVGDLTFKYSLKSI